MAGVIQPIGAAGAAVMAMIHAQSFPPNQAWGTEAISLMLGLPGHFGLMAETAGEPMGFALAQANGPEAELLTLAVRPGARGRGYGFGLLQAVMGEAQRRGAQEMFLEVAEGNAPARALYALMRAEEVGRRRRYYADGADALVLRLGLG